MKYCYCLHLRQSIKNTIKSLVKGQEITFLGNTLFIYDLFPEIEVFSDNSVLDLVFIPGCMSLRISETKQDSWLHGMSLSFSGFFPVLSSQCSRNHSFKSDCSYLLPVNFQLMKMYSKSTTSCQKNRNGNWRILISRSGFSSGNVQNRQGICK